MALSIVATILRVLQRKEISKITVVPIVLFLVFFLLAVTDFGNDLTPYGSEKLSRFLVLTTWSFLCPMLLADFKNIKKSISRYSYGMATLSFIIVAFAAYEVFVAKGQAMFLTSLGSNYLMLGKMSAILIVFLSMSLIHGNNKLLKKTTLLMLIALSAYILLLTGGRMPVISLVVCMVLFLLKGFKVEFNLGKVSELRISKKLLLFIPVLIGALGTTVYYLEKNSVIFWVRFKLLFDGGGASANTRVTNYEKSFDMIKEKPLFGHGFGGFQKYTGSMSERSYPHNILLEIFSEQGFISMLCFVTLIAMSLFVYFKYFMKNSDKFTDTIFIILLYLIINAMVSGDLNDNRIVFAFLAIALTTPLVMVNRGKSVEGGVA